MVMSSKPFLTAVLTDAAAGYFTSI
jgi:hypothetical protein